MGNGSWPIPCTTPRQAPAPAPGDPLVTLHTGQATRPPGHPRRPFSRSGPCSPSPNPRPPTPYPSDPTASQHRTGDPDVRLGIDRAGSVASRRPMCRQLVGPRRPVLLGAARRHPARQGILPGVLGARGLPRRRDRRREPWGVWGGELFANGKVLAQKRVRGRPPKVRVPEPELEELVPAYRVERRLSRGGLGFVPSRARPPSPHTAGRGDGGALLPPVPHEPRSAAVKRRGARRPGRYRVSRSGV